MRSGRYLLIRSLAKVNVKSLIYFTNSCFLLHRCTCLPSMCRKWSKVQVTKRGLSESPWLRYLI